MRNIKLIANAILVIMVCSSYAYAEMNSKLTMDVFLTTAKKDYSLVNYRELEEYLRTAPKSTPYLDRVEFRTQTEEFEYTKQRYSVRLYPKGWGETGCNRLLAEKMKHAVQIEHLEYYNTALQNRYRLILGFFRTTTLINLKKELLTVYDDRITVLKQKGMHNIQFDINALIVAEDMYTEIHLDLVDLQNEWSSNIYKIQIAAGIQTDVLFDEKNVIGVDKIAQLIKNIQFDTNIDNISLQDRKSKIEIAKIKYDLEIAKNKNFLSLIELAYDTDDRDEFNKAFSIELGFKLPGINPDREQVNNRKLKYLQAKLNYEAEKREAYESVRSLSMSLKRLIKQYNILVDRKENSNADISFKTYMAMEGIDPLDLLKLRESILISDIRLNRVNYRIRLKYINLMDKMGKLSEKPLKNYISSQMENIQ